MLRQWFYKWLGIHKLASGLLTHDDDIVLMMKRLTELEGQAQKIDELTAECNVLRQELIELRANMPNKAPRIARNFTEFRTAVEGGQ